MKRYKYWLLLGAICSASQNVSMLTVPQVMNEIITYLQQLYQGDSAADQWFPALGGMALKMLMFVGIALFFMFFKRLLMISASRHVEYDFRNAIYEKILRLSMPYFDRNKTGDIMARTTNDMNAVRAVIGPGIMRPIDTVLIVSIAYFKMSGLNWKLTLLTLIPAALMIYTMLYFRPRIFKASRKVQDQFGDMSEMVRENLSGMRVVRAYGREATEQRRFEAMSAEYIRNNMSLAWIEASFRPALFMVLQLSIAVIMFGGGWFVFKSVMPLGDLVEFFFLFQQMIWPLIAFGWIISLIQRGRASMNRMTELLDYESDIEETAAARMPEGGMQGHIQINHLTFQYPSATAPALIDIDIDLSPGKTLGIIGGTGAGKSTLIQLIPRLYNAEPGRIQIDGIPIEAWPLAELRRGIGIVTQETFLFSDTIASNIAFGSQNGIDRSRVKLCGEIAQLKETIEEFNDGLDTLLGERGVNLSGGQKQRTAIARAVYRDPKILILDDALSAVDTETENKILAGLREVMKERTTLLISHRISTVMLADEIIFLDEGRIVERGTHEELVKLGKRYAELHQEQVLASEIESVN
ncbi:ABC transporter ATP-binding protein [Candidatus Sumerlaeota bacterium]|nr:ABC transporter ATP-binding protein [Candidatus Sumerlaeota bacterium]